MNEDLRDRRQPRDFVERRRKKDWMVRAVPIISGIGWFSMLIAVLFLDSAKPAQENFITRVLGARVVSHWNPLLLNLSLIASVEVFLVCLLGFLLNMMRRRRKTDRINRSIIVLWVLSVIYITVFLINFAYLLF